MCSTISYVSRDFVYMTICIYICVYTYSLLFFLWTVPAGASSILLGVYRCIRCMLLSLFIVAALYMYIYIWVLSLYRDGALYMYILWSAVLLVDPISDLSDPTPPKSQNSIFQSVLLTRARARRPQTLGFGHLEGSK